MTPKSLGYRMPAEWEPHLATWVSWPHREASWPGKLHVIQPVFAQMVAALATSEPVHINVNDQEMEDRARELLEQAGAAGELHFHRFATNDAWCRDHGAIMVRREAGAGQTTRPPPADSPPADSLSATAAATLAAVNWEYNAWGGKYPPYDLDNQIPGRMAETLGVPQFDGRMVLEGGSVDVNGAGLLLTTESCLLNPNRNPQLTRGEIELRLQEFLGVDEIWWLKDGILGDDTDGHIDDLARFVAADVIVTSVEDDEHDENYAVLAENLKLLHALAERSARTIHIVPLPMPPPVIYEDERLPASYANFYIGNRVVLVPGYDPPRDREAIRVLSEFFPDRELITIDCRDMIWGLGAMHCLTQQIPMP